MGYVTGTDSRQMTLGVWSIVADFKVTDSASDRGQLCDCMQMCMEDLELDTVKAIADKGYESGKDIADCLMNGIVPDVGFIQDREERVFSLDYREKEITPELKAPQSPRTSGSACMPACCRTATKASTSAYRFSLWAKSVASFAMRTAK